MPRPEFISHEDLKRWSDLIDHDPMISQSMVESPIVREVCYAGLWLSEELEKLQCPEDIIVKLQWTGGKLSFGRDAWQAHQQLLEMYINNELIFEDDPDVITN